MKILSLSVQSLTGLNIQSVSFTNPTLLVGLSGSGKSQILTCIYHLFQVLVGENPMDLEDGNYQIEFAIDEHTYLYQAQIQNSELKNPQLTCDGQQLEVTTLMTPTIHFVNPVESIRKSEELINRLSSASIDEQNEIKSLYKFFFETIEQIEIHPNQLLFKEKAMNWISYQQLSDGMLKTFIYVCELVLSEPGTVLLIDEFENGLGLNCMNVLLEEIILRDDLQFILSSHHPYIINNIPTLYWQIVSRNQDTITARSSEDFGIGQTKYDAFFELMNGLYYEEDL